MMRGLRLDSAGREQWSTRRNVSLLLLSALIPMFTGCRTWGPLEELSPDQFLATPALDPSNSRIVGVTTADGEYVAFSRDPALDESRLNLPTAVLQRDTLYGFVRDEPYQVALSDVERVWVTSKEMAVQEGDDRDQSFRSASGPGHEWRIWVEPEPDVSRDGRHPDRWGVGLGDTDSLPAAPGAGLVALPEVHRDGRGEDE